MVISLNLISDCFLLLCSLLPQIIYLKLYWTPDYGPDTIVGSRDAAANKDKSPTIIKLTVYRRDTDNKQVKSIRNIISESGQCCEENKTQGCNGELRDKSRLAWG